VQSILLHFSTLSCHQTVYNQRLAKLHTFFKLELFAIQLKMKNYDFSTVACIVSSQIVAVEITILYNY